MLGLPLFPVRQEATVAEGNPFVLDDEDDETPQVGSENANFKQLREYAKKLERENKAREKEIERLQAFESKDRLNTLKSAGLSEKHASLFLRVNEGQAVTPELVQAFVQEYEIPVTRAEDAQVPEAAAPEVPQGGEIIELTTPETQAKPPGFAPTPPAGQAQGGFITDVAEAQKLLVTNPAEYARMREAGRIQLAKLPGSES